MGANKNIQSTILSTIIRLIDNHNSLLIIIVFSKQVLLLPNPWQQTHPFHMDRFHESRLGGPCERDDRAACSCVACGFQIE